MKPVVFISYRRDDTASEVQVLAEALRKRYGYDSVFVDVPSIHPGSRWRAELEDALKAVNIVLVVIGPGWLMVSDEHGRRRIDQKEDWVRRELKTAFAMNKHVIPIYVKGAREIPREALPRSISKLADWQRVELRRDYLHDDVPIVLNAVKKAAALIDQEPRTSTISPETVTEESPLTISGRKTEVYLREGDGDSFLEPQYINISLRSSKIDLPPIIDELRRQMVARLEASQPPVDGGVAPWNSPHMAALTTCRPSRTPDHEHIVINLDMHVNDYATFAATVLSLDSEFEKTTQDGQPVQTTLRREYFPTPADISRAVINPVPFLANGVGVVLLAFTRDGKVILARRRSSSRARPGQRDVSVVEGIHRIHDASGSNRVDVYGTAIRACREELGVRVTNHDVQLLGFGVDMKYYQWNFFGAVEFGCTSDDVMELHASNAKDRWEGQLQAVVADPVTVFEQLLSDGSWDTALVTTYLAFCNRIGIEETRRAAAQAFGGKPRSH